MSSKNINEYLVSCIKIVLFIVVFIVAVSKDALNVQTFWVLMLLALFLNIGLEIQSVRGKVKSQKRASIINEIDVMMTNANAFFSNGIRDNSIELIEQATILYADCVEELKLVEGINFKKISCWTALAICYEKLAYYGAETTNLYTVQNGNSVQKKENSNGDSKLGISPSRASDCIYCTEVKTPHYWTSASDSYSQVLNILNSADLSSTTGDAAKLTASARSAGYFFLCDHLTFDNTTSLNKSEQCLQIALIKCKSGKHASRTRDIEALIQLVLIEKQKEACQ